MRNRPGDYNAEMIMNDFIKNVAECYENSPNNVQIISADLGEQLVVREKTIYDEPGSTIAVAMLKNVWQL